MGTIGNQIAAGQALTIANDSFNGDGSTVAFTLSQTVSSVNDIEVLVDNVQQSPYDSSYSVSGTTLTFSSAPSTGTNNVYVIYNASRHITTQQVIPDDGSVHSSKIADGAVTHAKLHTDMDLSTKNVNPITMSTGTNKMQMAIQSAVSNRFAIRSTHTADYDNNPFIVYQPSGAGHQNDALVISPEGYITQNKQPGFSVRQLAQSGIDCSSSDYIAFRHIHTTHFNLGNHFSSSTGMFTAPIGGYYVFGATIRYDGFSGSYFYASIYRNGNFYARELTSLQGSYLHSSIHTIVNMSVNDTVHIAIRNSGDSNISLDHDCNFYGYLLG